MKMHFAFAGLCADLIRSQEAKLKIAREALGNIAVSANREKENYPELFWYERQADTALSRIS